MLAVMEDVSEESSPKENKLGRLSIKRVFVPHTHTHTFWSFNWSSFCSRLSSWVLRQSNVKRITSCSRSKLSCKNCDFLWLKSASNSQVSISASNCLQVGNKCNKSSHMTFVDNELKRDKAPACCFKVSSSRPGDVPWLALVPSWHVAPHCPEDQTGPPPAASQCDEMRFLSMLMQFCHLGGVGIIGKNCDVKAALGLKFISHTSCHWLTHEHS